MFFIFFFCNIEFRQNLPIAESAEELETKLGTVSLGRDQLEEVGAAVRALGDS